MPLRNTPIRRKLMLIILLTSGIVMLLMRGAFFTYEFLTFRQITVRQLSTLGEILATNSTAALAFDNQDDAKEILLALKAEKYVIGAALYDRNGGLFARYPETSSPDTFPTAPGKDGYRFEESHLTDFQPVVQGDRRLGTLYLRFDTGAIMRELMWSSFGIASAVMAVVLLVAYLLSRTLQRQISQPIVALAGTARAISENSDYSVRAVKYGEDELGLLTDAFNQMLAQIQEQGRIRTQLAAIVQSSDDAIVSKTLEGVVTSWNSGAEKVFGYSTLEATGQSMVRLLPRNEPRRRLCSWTGSGAGKTLTTLKPCGSGRTGPTWMSTPPFRRSRTNAATSSGFRKSPATSPSTNASRCASSSRRSSSRCPAFISSLRLNSESWRSATPT